MADLDDFFAKKDKKKNKGVRSGAPAAKFSTVDQVARHLENTETPPPARPRPKKDKTDETPGANEEDEWREFEEQKKDYSGLRIQNMQLSDQAELEASGADDDGEDEDGNRRNAPGPWKKSQVQKEDSDDEVAPVEETAPAPPPSSSGGGNGPSAYVPPALRNASAMGPSQSHSNRGGRSGRSAPDINNEAYFPTLSAASAAEPAGAWGKKGRREDEMRGFEDVRNSKSHSSRMGEGVAGGGSRNVAMENKFAALRGADQS